MRRFFCRCLYSLLLSCTFCLSLARAASPSQEDSDVPRYPVFAYLVAGFTTLFILVIAGLPSRKES